MACTTILVGKKASYNGSTMIARNDDGGWEAKKLVVVNPKDQPRKYKCKISHLEIELPDNPLRYTATPNVKIDHGLWPANGINSANVAMTATETTTSNPRVMGLDPLVVYKPKEKGQKEQIGGIGEEDLVTLVLPYIKSAKEGVYRLGELLEKYGTYESNGIAFSDENEIWWFESIGGHHFIARRVKDDEYVMMPNQFGLDRFDFEDAYGKQIENICSKDLKQFVYDNNLLLKDTKVFNPRYAFGSRSDSDHIYNTPRAWFIGRYFNPNTYKWDGENADYKPESDDIPWSMVPESKITVEDVKYILSSYYQGTPYNPYQKADIPTKGKYRPIAVANTSVMAVLEIRNNVPDEIKAIEWLCYAGNAFNTLIPLYANVNKIPSYLSNTTSTIETNNFYWASRLIAPLVDANYGNTIIFVERYQKVTMNKGHETINKYDKLMIESKDYSLCAKANEEITALVKKETDNLLNQVLLVASNHMKTRYFRGDN